MLSFYDEDFAAGHCMQVLEDQKFWFSDGSEFPVFMKPKNIRLGMHSLK